MTSQPLSRRQRMIANMSSREAPEDAIDFTQPWRFSDITFIVEEQKIYANKTVLSMWSPVMEAMFHSDFREKRAVEIDLPEKTFDDVVELMRVLHPPNADICANNVAPLLPLLQEYQIDSLLTRCEELLMSQGTSINNYLLAQKYNLKELEEKALNNLKRAPIMRLRAEPDFDKLDKKLLVDIMMERCERFEKCAEEMRDVRHVIERKRPNISFPGMHLLCDTCKGARDQQAECLPCMKSCCKRVAEIVRQLDRY